METIVNVELSRSLAERIETTEVACWKSAAEALLALADAAAEYVEGWIVNQRGLVLEHAWVEVDGAIVDPSLYDYAVRKYVAGPRWPYSEVKAFAFGGELYLPLVHNRLNQQELVRRYELAFHVAAEQSAPAPGQALNRIKPLRPSARATASRVETNGRRRSTRSVSQMQHYCDRAVQRIMNRYPYLDTLRAVTHLATDNSRLFLDITIGIYARGTLQAIQMTAPRRVLTDSENDAVLTLETLLDKCVERYLGNA